MFKSIATSTPTKATFYINRLAKASYTTTSLRMQNQAGQGASHAVGDSKVPGSVQEKVPQSVEEGLPNSVCCSLRFAGCGSIDIISRSTTRAPRTMARAARLTPSTAARRLSCLRASRRLSLSRLRGRCRMPFMTLATNKVEVLALR